MTETIQFFTPLFSSVLFNHSNLSLVELSFFTSMLVFITVGEIVSQKPDSSYPGIGYLLSITLLLSSIYLGFCELIWWKAIINIAVSLTVFYFLLVPTINVLVAFSGMLFKLNPLTNEIVPKRSTSLFIATITILAIILLVLLEKKIF